MPASSPCGCNARRSTSGRSTNSSASSTAAAIIPVSDRRIQSALLSCSQGAGGEASPASSGPANRMDTTSTRSPRASLKPMALRTRVAMRARSSVLRSAHTGPPSGLRVVAPSTMTARLMRFSCGCSRTRVRTVLLIS